MTTTAEIGSLRRRLRRRETIGIRALPRIKASDAIGERGKGIAGRRMHPTLGARSQAVTQTGRWLHRLTTVTDGSI